MKLYLRIAMHGSSLSILAASNLPQTPAPGSGEAAQVALAVMLVIVGLIVLFLLTIITLRLVIRAQRAATVRERDSRSLDIDAWEAAGERTEPYPQRDEQE